MALARMGSPETVAFDMAKLHNDKTNIVISIISILIIVFRALISFLSILGIEGRLSFVSLHLEFALIITLIVMIVIAIKMRNRFLSCFTFCVYLLIPVYNVYLSAGSDYGSNKYVSSIVVSLIYFITGKINRFAFVSQKLADVRVADWVVVLSVIIFFAVAAVMLAAIILSNKSRPTIKQKKQLTVLTAILFSLLGIIAVLRITMYFESAQYPWETGNDCITIVEADKPYDITKQYIENYKIYDVMYDWSDYLPFNEDLPSDYTEEQFDSIIITYKINNNYLEYTPTKEYVYVISSPDEIVFTENGIEGVEYNPENWFNTNQKHQFAFPIEQNDYPININHVTILPREE